MKKNQRLHTGMIAIVALIVGILIGSVLQWPNFHADDLRGTIGRADRYRNVQITENDILLRNEFLDEPEKQEMYRNYLNYFYIRAMRTSAELNKAVVSARLVPEFRGTFLEYAESLDGFANYLDATRTDILKALEVIVNIEAQPQVPVVEYLNQANNVIARMRQYDNVLIDFLIAIESFLDFNPDTEFPGLADAHDLLAFSLMESALVTQNKPMLRFLDKHPLANDSEGVKELISGMAQLDVGFTNQFNLDAEKLGTGFTLSSEHLGQLIDSDAGRLALGYYADTENLGFIRDNENLGKFFSGDKLQLHFLDAASLSNVLGSEQWGKIIYTDSEVLEAIGW